MLIIKNYILLQLPYFAKFINVNTISVAVIPSINARLIIYEKKNL